MLVSRSPRRLNVHVKFEAGKTAFVLALVVVSLTAAHQVGQFCIFYFDHRRLSQLARLFDLGAERNIPTLYSSAALLCCAALLALIASAKNNGESRQWWGLALIFCFLCADEAFAFHERLIHPLQTLFNVSGPLYYAWVIPYGILVGLFVALYGGFTLRLPSATRRLFLLAGAMYLSGALGFELIEGIYSSRAGDTLFAVLITFEECLEMSGIIVFIYALMSYLEAEMKMTAFRMSFFFNGEQSA